MAHLLEHLVFKGTPSHPNIPQELTAHGARPNGSTWFDRTNYFETFAATDENLKWALDLEADRMINSYIAKKDLDSEMTVVRNEFEMGENDPASILEERVLSTAFLWHNYGKSTIGAQVGPRERADRPPAGLLPDLLPARQRGAARRRQVRRGEDARRSSTRRSGRSRSPRARCRPSTRSTRRRTASAASRSSASATSRRSPRRTTCPSGTDPSSGAVNLLEQVLTDTPSGRLYKALVETKKATSVGGYFMELHDPGFVIFNAEVRQDQDVDDGEDGARPDARRRRGSDADHEGRGRPRPRHAAEEHRPHAEQRRPRRPEPLRVHRPGRLAPLLPEPRPDPRAPRSRTCRRRPPRT